MAEPQAGSNGVQNAVFDFPALYQVGYQAGYSKGYAAGYTDCCHQDSNSGTLRSEAEVNTNDELRPGEDGKRQNEWIPVCRGTAIRIVSVGYRRSAEEWIALWRLTPEETKWAFSGSSGIHLSRFVEG